MLTVTVEPAFLALTTTPSIAPSASEVICPVRAAGGWLCARTSSAGTSVTAKTTPMPSSKRFICIDSSRRSWVKLEDTSPRWTIVECVAAEIQGLVRLARVRLHDVLDVENLQAPLAVYRFTHLLISRVS